MFGLSMGRRHVRIYCRTLLGSGTPTPRANALRTWGLALIWDFPKTKGYLVGGLYDKDPTI